MFGFPIPDWAAKAIAGALMAIALLMIGRQWGASGVYEDWIASNEKAAVASAKIVRQQDVVTEMIRIQYRDQVIYRDGETKFIEKEVTRYVEGKPLTLACMLDSDWVRLHNAAAAGSIPTAGPRNDAGATGAKAAP